MKKHTLAFAAFASVLGIALSSVSFARSDSAILGAATNTNGSTDGCFTRDVFTGRVQNVCGVVRWMLGMELDSNGGHSGTFTINAPDLSVTQCRVVGIADNGTGLSSSGFHFSTAVNTFVAVPWGGVNVPSSGLMYLDCQLNTNAIISKADHSPN